MQTYFQDFQNSLGPTPNLPHANMDNPLADFSTHSLHLYCDPDVCRLLCSFLQLLYFNLKTLYINTKQQFKETIVYNYNTNLVI